MKYLAFDIEAANGYKLYSICSVGVVIADENFNIIFSENIWINPKCKYNLNGTRQNVGIDLKLDKDLLDKSPTFSESYSKIKSLLENEDYLVMGHAVDSDVRMLNSACEHFKLPPLKFNFICTQLLYKLFKKEKDVKALHKIASELNLEFQEHNSESDAWMSLMTLKYLVETTQLSVFELISKYQIRIGNTENFVLTRSVSLLEQISKKTVTKLALEFLREQADSTKCKNKVISGNFAIARSLELKKETKSLVVDIIENGGMYTTRLHKCDYYIKADEISSQDAIREKRLVEIKKTKDIIMLTQNDFYDLIKNRREI